MASSGLQLLGFFLSLVGTAATVASTIMVEWRKEVQGKHYTYEGLWMACSGTERTTCENHKSVLKLAIEIQATRAVMLVTLFLSAIALMVSIIGMKCTHFMDSMPASKSRISRIGGILFMTAGLMTIIITSWYVTKIVKLFQESHKLQSREFGHAVFVSWLGGLLTMVGGIFLGCQRCSRSPSSESISSNHLLPTANPKSNYV
ncbi:claudin-19-like [Cololabis saira]|uniref:claudin-19-like n=1 Tax=Cololabis saira TaxID=129043 RepID=UPI002AD58B6C|nr:claudin-19-like [Cololabis saira]